MGNSCDYLMYIWVVVRSSMQWWMNGVHYQDVMYKSNLFMLNNRVSVAVRTFTKPDETSEPLAEG